ncbi:MAG: nucleotidyltransferase family protein [Cyanobium sp.]
MAAQLISRHFGRTYDFAMPLTESHREHWRLRWARQERSLEERRRALLEIAPAIATALQARWPGVTVRLFGSVRGAGFHMGSDLDLGLEGLPAEALLEAMRLAEDQADAAAERRGLAPIAVDLVQLEALPKPWRERIRATGQPMP